MNNLYLADKICLTCFNYFTPITEKEFFCDHICEQTFYHGKPSLKKQHPEYPFRCPKCGAEEIAKSPLKKLCFKCRVLAERAYAVIHNKEIRERRKRARMKARIS